MTTTIWIVVSELGPLRARCSTIMKVAIAITLPVLGVGRVLRVAQLHTAASLHLSRDLFSISRNIGTPRQHISGKSLGKHMKNISPKLRPIMFPLQHEFPLDP